MKPLPIGSVPYLETATVAAGAGLVALLYWGAGDVLPASTALHPADMALASAWLAMRVVALWREAVRWWRWHRVVVWRVEI